MQPTKEANEIDRHDVKEVGTEDPNELYGFQAVEVVLIVHHQANIGSFETVGNMSLPFERLQWHSKRQTRVGTTHEAV